MPTILVIDHDQAPGTVREFTKIDPTVPALALSLHVFDCRQGDPAVLGSAISVGATAQEAPFAVVDEQPTVDLASTDRQRLLADPKKRTGEASFIRRVS